MKHKGGKITDIPPRQLLGLVARDDSYAFSVFFERYYKHVLRCSYWFTHNSEATAEVTENVFLKVYRYRNLLPEVRDIDSYLCMMARHEAEHWLRERHKRQESMPMADIPLDMAENIAGFPSDNADSAVLGNDLRKQLDHEVEGLPERCRRIFLMSRSMGLSNREIAGRLGITESTVRVQLKLASDRLSKALRKEIGII